jgi:hypothetical protein
MLRWRDTELHARTNVLLVSAVSGAVLISPSVIPCSLLTALQVQAEKMGVPIVDYGIREYHELEKLGIRVNWKGKLHAPAGTIDDEGYAILPGSSSSLASRSPVLSGQVSL